MKVWLASYIIKHKNKCPAALQKLAIACLVFELSKLRLRAHNLFDGLFERD